MARREGFMELPGEIRNEIYELVVLNMQNEYEMQRLVRCRSSLFPPQPCGYRGLTQLCRQVRREFLPFWQQRHVYVEVDLSDLARFVETFYDTDDTQAMADANGSIEISLDRDPRHGLNQVDLLPFLRLMVSAPRLQSRFVAMNYIGKDGPPNYIADLVTLSRLAKVQRDEVRRHFQSTLTQLILSPLPSPSKPPPILQLHLSPELSCYDLTMRKKILHETGFKSLKTIELRIVFDKTNYCEDFRRVNDPDSDRLQFKRYIKSRSIIPRQPVPTGGLGQFRISNVKSEVKDGEKPGQVVVWEQKGSGQLKSDDQQRSTEQHKDDGLQNDDGKQSSGLRARLRDSFQNWSILRKRKRNTSSSS